MAAAQTGGGQSDVRHEPSAPNLDAANSPPRSAAVDVGSGFPADPAAQNKAQGEFSPSEWTQVLDAYYGANVWPAQQQVEVNNLRRHLLEEVAGVEGVHESYILPGRTDFSAWWGWWKDIPGQDGSEQDQTPSGDGTDGDIGRIYDLNDYQPGQASGNFSPACGTHGDTPTNALCGANKDEFVWRGDSTWMIDDGTGSAKPCYNLEICEPHPADSVQVFMQPGTIDFNSFAPAASTLNDGADHGARPDTSLVDDTASKNGQAYFNEGNNWAYNYHRSLLITTRIVTSVNPEPTGFEGKFNPWKHANVDTSADSPGVDGEDGMVDTDFYSSISPAVEDAFRFAVWDPHDSYDCSSATDVQREHCDSATADPNNRESTSPFPTNPVPGFGTNDQGEFVMTDGQNDRGAYEAVKFAWNDGLSVAFDESVEAQETGQEPVASTLGFTTLAAGGHVQLHEPNLGAFTGPTGTSHAGDVYPGATFQNTNEDAVYLADTDESTPFYYDSTTCDQAGPDCEVPDGWDGYENNDMLWADAEAEFQQPCWCVLLYGDFTTGFTHGFTTPNTGAQASNEERQQTMTPGNLRVQGVVGLWHDQNDDDFVGRLGEVGRFTEPDDPYQEGTIEDPNDYGDTAGGTASDPAKFGFAEFTGVAKEASESTITIVPLTEPEDHDNDPTTPKQRPWGEMGVYLMHDSDTDRGANFNPWDDAAADSTPEAAYWGETSYEEMAFEALGCIDPPSPVPDGVGGCEDPGWITGTDDDGGERGNRHVTHGPIHLTYVPSEFKNAGTFSVFEGKKDVVFPTGAFDYPVKITTTIDFPTGTTVKARSPKDVDIGNSGTDVTGQQLTDVDVLVPADGSWTAR